MQNILSKIIDSLIERKNSPLFWSILLAVIILYIFLTNRYKACLGIPDWTYRSEENCVETITSNMELKAGKATFRPQIIIRTPQKVMLIINISSLYNENSTTLKQIEQNEKSVSSFQLSIPDQQLEKLESLMLVLGRLLDEKLEKHPELSNNYEIFDARIVDISYQTVNMNHSQPCYLYCTTGETRQIQKNEVQLRSTKHTIDLDDYISDANIYENTELIACIDECIENMQK